MENDRVVVRMVVVVLGSLGLLGLSLIGLLAYQTKPIPDALVAIVTGSLGAVAGLLAKTATEPPA